MLAKITLLTSGDAEKLDLASHTGEGRRQCSNLILSNSRPIHRTIAIYINLSVTPLFQAVFADNLQKYHCKRNIFKIEVEVDKQRHTRGT